MTNSRTFETAAKGRAGLIARLRRETAGNALAMTAAGLIPLLGIVGAGVDIGRTYAAKTKLQHACDSAVLAGRQAMSGTVWGTAAQQRATSFFNAAYPAGKYGSGTPSFSASASSEGDVSGTASVTMPMSVMTAFGRSSASVSATCKAELNLPDTDVMFVLDTTGSMSETNAGDSSPRINVLRSSVSSFHNNLETVKPAGSVVRYGFVPYSETVNVGHLLQASWIKDSTTYQSRVYDGNTSNTSSVSTGTSTTYAPNYTYVSGSTTNVIPGTSVTSLSYPTESCPAAPANTQTTTQPTTTVSTTWNAAVGVAPTGTPAGNTVVFDQTRTRHGTTYSRVLTATSCTITATTFNNYREYRRGTTRPVYTGGTTSYTHFWIYDKIPYDTSSFGLGTGSITAAIGSTSTSNANPPANRTVTWNGCIEERATVRQTSTSYVPSLGLDMDIDALPTTDPATQWAPSMAKLVYARKGLGAAEWFLPQFRTSSGYTNIGDHSGGAYAVCPVAARNLAPITSSALTSYLATLVPSGQTYHDIGLVWGARLISPTGLFSSLNNSSGVSRHLIFMTDGDTDTEVDHYDAYGWGPLDRRREILSGDGINGVAPTKANQDATVAARLAALCTATKNKGIRLWVIAFGTSMTSTLETCASPGSSFQANNATALNDAFTNIAAQISQLRLTE